MRMGIMTEVIAWIALICSILFADSMLDNPIAFTAAVGSLVFLAIVVKGGDEK